MGRLLSFIGGAAAGLAVSAVFLYLFAPARDTTFDENYRSRLDWALDEGRRAAIEQEEALRMQFAADKRGKPSLPTAS